MSVVAALAIAIAHLKSEDWEPSALEGAKTMRPKGAPPDPASLSETERAVDFVRSEALGASGSADPDNDAFRAYAALSASNYVRTLMSSARYSLAVTTPGTRIPKGTELCLLDRRGICGNHVEGFVAIMKALGVPVREVQVYYAAKSGRRASHILADVQWNKAWRMIDVTWGYVPHRGSVMDALSFRQARKRGGTAGWHDEVDLWRASAVNAKADLFEYLSAASADILIAGSGTIRPYVVEKEADRVRFGLEHIPNYFGRRGMLSGSTGEVAFEIDMPGAYPVLTVIPLHASCRDGVVIANNERRPMSSEPMVFTGIGRKVVLRAEGTGRECYFVVKELYATKALM